MTEGPGTRWTLSPERLSLAHTSATPGRIVTASIELTEVAGRALHFNVSCSDDHGLIGEGKHERAIIDLERFMQKMAQR
jgi:fluoroacetyl-CoA thioesterase